VHQAALKVHEAVELAKRGVNATFSQVLLDQGKEAWVSRTTVLVPARHKHWQERAGVDKGGKVPTTLVEDAKADGCVTAKCVGGWVDQCLADMVSCALPHDPVLGQPTIMHTG